MDETALVIHGHFYQPPRENPRTGVVEEQPGARPFHDWNERVHAECYRPNAFARVSDGGGRVGRVVNNYAGVSFNFGPTLLAWLERHHPTTYARILAADAASARARGGHGNAFAQGYHHAILPLADERDRRTEIRWGLADFRRRFGREAESLWLPETACDAATLAALVEEGLRFVVLAPHQAARVRRLGPNAARAPDNGDGIRGKSDDGDGGVRESDGGDESPRESNGEDGGWLDVRGGKVDTTVPYLFRHPDGSGRGMAVFFYDGRAARAVAFEGALASSRQFVDLFERAARGGAGALAHVATDGESYGHHFKFGDRCLAYALAEEAPRRGFRPTNYGEFLERNAPEWEVELAAWAGDAGAAEGTAWSCAHGLGRWSRDCGCNSGAPAGWTQKWRAPLRRALDFLRDEAARLYEEQGGALLRDPWEARDAYVELIVDPGRDRDEFFRAQSDRALGRDEQRRALALLELQRSTLMTFTSCGWFFNDISGIETVQVLRYAARALELFGALGRRPPRSQFLELLAQAESNEPGAGNGADVFRNMVEVARPNPRPARAAGEEGSGGDAPVNVNDAPANVSDLPSDIVPPPRESRAEAGRMLLLTLSGSPSGEVFGETLTAALRHAQSGGRAQYEELFDLLLGAAFGRPPEQCVEAVNALSHAARLAGVADPFERAQELAYERAVREGARPPGGLRRLADWLKLSPSVFDETRGAGDDAEADGRAGTDAGADGRAGDGAACAGGEAGGREQGLSEA